MEASKLTMVARRSTFRSAALAVGLAAALGACAPGAPQPAANAPAANAAPREVRTARVAREPWERTLGATGELAAFEESELSVKVPGRLLNLAFDLGARVKRGTVVAEIDPRDYELRLAQAAAAVAAARTELGLAPEGEDDATDVEATTSVHLASTQLAEARRNHERAQKLVQDRVGTQAELDDAETMLRLAETRLQAAHEAVQNRRAVLAQRRADLALARQQLADTRVVAPFDGTIGARVAATGDYLAAGAPIARLVRTDPLRLRLRVPEREAGEVRVGQRVDFAVDGDEHGLLRGAAPTVTRIAPALGAQSRALLVEIEIPNPAPAEPAPHADGGTAGNGGTSASELRPGSFVRARIVVDEAANALTVPVEAVASFAGIDKLLLVRDGKVAEARVKLGRSDGKRIEVLEGIAEGDEVVLAPGNLGNGAAVRVAR